MSKVAKKTDYKRQLTLKGNSVKRSSKEFLYYVNDTEKEEAKLKKMKEENTSSEGDLKRQTDIVAECEGAKKQCFQNVEKFKKELENFLTLLDTPSQDEEDQKLRTDAKELPEYTAAKEFLATANEIIEKHGASFAK